MKITNLFIVQKQKLNELVEKLIKLGGDRDELTFWNGYFDFMQENNRQKLFENLEKELRDLQALKR